MSETLLQAAAAAAAQRRRLLLRAAASERVCFIPVPKPEYYSLRQGKEERGREGGSREEREGGSREEGGREQRGTAGACREKLGKRRESAERSRARGGEAGRAGGEKRGAHPLPDPAGAQLGGRRLAPLRSARARGRARIVCGCEQPGSGLERSGPRACNGRAGSRAPGAPRDSSLGTSASARVPGAGGSWLGARRGEAGNCGRVSGSPFPGSRSPVAGAYSVSPARRCLRGAGSRSSPSLGPGGWSQAAAAASCGARGGRESGGLQEDQCGGPGNMRGGSVKPRPEGRRSGTLTRSRGRICRVTGFLRIVESLGRGGED